ncbi:hypothetical protein Dda_6783 [Drechslerella dactyloides]|uniref:Uncharacterized protein n=1 Tax=Drechslerella dactyloides TaxID=74499 RepID=A0AAD6IYG3_DREDA|nr:hypothetical protein Dda_6783 [Drechslerella dactyloides]
MLLCSSYPGLFHNLRRLEAEKGKPAKRHPMEGLMSQSNKCSNLELQICNLVFKAEEELELVGSGPTLPWRTAFGSGDR